ncbi:MAG: TonB-dependent receptor [Candidatus Marinimicrobia bacterium]|nr:TonB-dependent receptor [Candidatus Neomarinimicrobiota bacterium]MBL7010143.1 TonB-dependent receptor [Candidatus Neomarinimicrobiota bacterium]MBL7030408.1 TonB-dependent receptor [Candidatus Neomarinimicrobiota bacterium]
MSKILPLFVLTSIIWGIQPQINGFVRNGDTPLPNAIIVHHLTGSWTISNDDGYFSSMGSVGDTITIFHYGYKQYRTVIPHEFPIMVQLDMDPLEMKTIHVIGDKKKMQVSHFPVKPGRNLSTTLGSIPSTLLRTYGGPGGISTVSIDGGLSSHTKILWNGIDLTSPQNGLTDLSQIPNFLINQISTGRTPALSHGSGSIDGSMEIHSSKSPQIDFSTGSFGTHSLAGRMNIPINKGSFSLDIGRYKSIGDFTYINNGASGKRKNNQFDQSFFSFSSSHAFTKQWFVSLQSLVTNQDRGIPGLVFSPSPDAHRHDNLILTKLKSIWQIPNHLFSLSATSRKSDEQYTNPQFAIDSNHGLATNQFELGWITIPIKSIEIDQKVTIKKESISSTNTDTISRIIQTYSHSIQWALTRNLLNESGLRFDREKSNFSVWTWQSGFEYLMKRSSISIAGGHGFRYPTFNDLYWKPGGNPKLLPESTNWIRFHWDTQIKGHQLSLRVSTKQSKNLIQWVPGEPYWQPQNIEKTRRNTWTFISVGSLFKVLRYNTHFTINNSKNINENKPMRYAPQYTGSFSLETEFQHMNGWIHGQFVGERITMYSWPRNVTMNPYWIFSSGVQYHLNPKISLLCSINNLFNNNYMTVKGYPEPGRNFSLSFQYIPTNKREKT